MHWLATTPDRLRAGDQVRMTFGADVERIVSSWPGTHGGTPCYVVRTSGGGTGNVEHYVAPDHTVLIWQE